MKRKKLPLYLQEIIGNYLKDRKITWIEKDGRKHEKVERGVQQRSVLGPLLWNIAYDTILRMAIPVDCDIVYMLR